MIKTCAMMLAMLALPFAAQAQTKFHDVEANEATGPVKSIESSVMGQSQTITFSQDGKMTGGNLKNVVYDADGYIKAAEMEGFQGMEMKVSYKWENGKIVSRTMDMGGGRSFTTTIKYNEKGAPASESMNFGGQAMENPYTNYKYDDHGNWISRTGSMMGQEMEQVRTIKYYE
ncbi:MAG: hypothetical protein IJ928_08780 [Prevotella sp.]|nr:hypothetical protein [Prevotella sp.]